MFNPDLKLAQPSGQNQLTKIFWMPWGSRQILPVDSKRRLFSQAFQTAFLNLSHQNSLPDRQLYELLLMMAKKSCFLVTGEITVKKEVM